MAPTLLCYLLCFVTYIIPNAAQNATTPTVDPLVVGFLETAMGNRLNITAEYCLWNVTLMIHLINTTDPEFLYDPTTKALLLDSGLLPQYVIQQFPPDLLTFYGLTVNSTAVEECVGTNIQSPLGIDSCVGPLVHSKLINPVNKDAEVRRISLKNVTGLDIYMNASLQHCGLSCAAGGETYGLTETEQNMVDIFKIIGCTLCFVAILFSFINQYIDQKKTGKRFVNKPLLQIIPYLITFALFLIVLLMTIGEVIGKESIVCYQNKEFSFWNPIEGKSINCTVHGIFFYSALLMYMGYTVLLSFVIFRQLYSPMRPLWNIRQRYWHLMLFGVIIVCNIIAIITSGFGGVWPMGVCLPGPSKKDVLFALVNLPFLLSCTASVLLLMGSVYLLRKEIRKQKTVANKASTHRIEDLVHRLIYYGIGVNACLILLSWTGMVFYLKSDALSDGLNESVACQIQQILLSPDIICPQRSADSKMSPFYFISWIIAAILGVTAQIILSMHNEARDRLKRAATLKDVGIGSKLGSFRDKMKDKTKTKSSSKDKNKQTQMIIVDSQSPMGSPENSEENGMDFGSSTVAGMITPTPHNGKEILQRINSGSIELLSVNSTDASVNNEVTESVGQTALVHGVTSSEQP